MQIPKNKPYRNKQYLNWIDGQPCLVCGKPSTHAHVRRYKWGAGTRQKSHDYCAIQLCYEHNTYANEREYGTDELIARNLMAYIEQLRKKLQPN